MTIQPPENRRILVTRAAHQASRLSDGLRAAGFEPVEVPVLEIRPPVGFEAFDHTLQNLSGYDWIIFTSPNAVRALVGRAARCGIDLSKGVPDVAAIGSATADAACQSGLHVALIPKEYVAESLVSAMVPRARGRRFLLARAAVARDVIPDALRGSGAVVDVIEVYRNAVPEEAPGMLGAALGSGVYGVTFTSSSSVTHLAEVAAGAGISLPFPGVKAFSIGPITSDALRCLGWPPVSEAVPHNIEGLIRAVKAEAQAGGESRIEPVL